MANADALDLIVPGATVGTTELPHRNLASALEFGFEAFDVPSAPALPNREAAEDGLAQVLAGVAGVGFDRGGELVVDADRLDPDAPIGIDLDAPGFGGLRAFIDRCGRRSQTGPVRWSLTGPLTAGLALCRAGAAPELGFPIAGRAVRAHLTAIAGAFGRAAPGVAQLVVLDESRAGEVTSATCGLAPSDATDLLSSALASIERIATAGVRAGDGADIALILEAGPRLVELPTTADVATYAGYLSAFLARGGWVTWGVVCADGPIVDTPTRAWRRLSTTWCGLVQRGCDPQILRRQALFAPGGGLAAHSPAGAAQIAATVADVARLVRTEASAARFVLGA